jgi:hypothetical protein
MRERPSYFPSVLAGIVCCYFLLVGLFFHQRDSTTPAQDAVEQLVWVIAGAAALVAVVQAVWIHDLRNYDPGAEALGRTQGYDTDD